MMGTMHKIVVDGERYNFEIVSEDLGDEVEFYIRAICKATRRTSCINNLNAVSSQLLTERQIENYDDHPEFHGSTWFVTKRKAANLTKKAKAYLSDSNSLSYLENEIDDDRYEGEWENIIMENGEIKEYEEEE